jgi:hypothetical protein
MAAGIQSVAPLAVVYPWWVLPEDPIAWPGVLRADSNDLDAAGKKRIHAYVIKRDDTDGERVDSSRVRRRYFYTILGFHYFFIGSQTNNSEKLFTAEIDAITAYFDNRTTLPAALGGVEVFRCRTRVNNKTFGEQLHLGFGSLELRPC